MMINAEDKHEVIAALNLATDTLGLYRAELARILGLQCQDVSNSMQLESILLSNDIVRNKAEKFLVLYRRLEGYCANDSVKMVHWLRVEHPLLGTTPFLALVDHNRLDEVVDLLRTLDASR